MDITRIKYFLDIVDTMSFYKAADLNFISPSSMTKAIRSLEDELGVTLLQRNNRSMQLTQAGEEFLLYARDAMIAYGNMLERMKKHSGAEEKVIRIMIIHVAISYHIVSSVLRFQQQHPDIIVLIEEVISNELLEALNKSTIDFGITRTNYLDMERYRMWPLVEDEMVAVVLRDHPLYDRAELSIRDFYDEKKMLLPNMRSDLFRLYKDAYAGIGLSLPEGDDNSYAYETYFGLLQNYQTSGIFMNKALQRPLPDTIRLIPLKEKIRSETALVSLKKKKLRSHEELFVAFLEQDRADGMF